MHDELIISLKKWVLNKMSAPSGSPHRTTNDETQTVIRVYPHILEKHDSVAKGKSDKKTQTVVSLNSKGDKKNFYSLLKYTPFQDISENCIRIIDLPRKTKLQFDSSYTGLSSAITPFCLADDDGVADFCSDMLRNMHTREIRRFKEIDTQTDLIVKPQILEDNQIATVFRETHTLAPLVPVCTSNQSASQRPAQSALPSQQTATTRTPHPPPPAPTKPPSSPSGPRSGGPPRTPPTPPHPPPHK